MLYAAPGPFNSPFHVVLEGGSKYFMYWCNILGNFDSTSFFADSCFHTESVSCVHPIHSMGVEIPTSIVKIR